MEGVDTSPKQREAAQGSRPMSRPVLGRRTRCQATLTRHQLHLEIEAVMWKPAVKSDERNTYNTYVLYIYIMYFVVFYLPAFLYNIAKTWDLSSRAARLRNSMGVLTMRSLLKSPTAWWGGSFLGGSSPMVEGMVERLPISHGHKKIIPCVL